MPKQAQPPRVRRQPQRTCVACRDVEGKRTLVRVVRTPDGTVELDVTGKKSGRGAYVHASVECVQKVVKTGGLSRALNVHVGAEVTDQLLARAAEGTGQQENSGA